MGTVNRIAIVPGHGGKNRGTRAINPDEASYVLDFGRRLSQRCRAMWPHSRFSLIRKGDTSLGLAEAAELSQCYGSGLALVIHVNAFSTSVLHGGAAFALDGDDLGRQVGNETLRAYPWELRPQHTGTWLIPRDASDWRRPIRNVLLPFLQRRISAVLIELFYATSADDVAMARMPSVVDRCHLAIMMGVASVMTPPR